MKSLKSFLAGLSIIIFVFAQSGCVTTSMVDTEFASGLPVNENPEIPFQKVWIKEGVDWDAYERIYLAPVNVNELCTMTWWQETGRPLQMKHDLYTIATLTRKEMNRAFLKGFGAKYRVEKTPGLNTIIFEIELAEVVPDKSVIFHAIVRDGNTNEELVKIADKVVGKHSMFDSGETAWGETVEKIIKEWPQVFVDVVNREPGEIIQR